MLVVQLPSVLSDVYSPIKKNTTKPQNNPKETKKKSTKKPKPKPHNQPKKKKPQQTQDLQPLARVYSGTTYFYLLLYQSDFCSTFQIKHIAPFKARPLKWTVCKLRIHFWWDKMVECSCYVFRNESNVYFSNKMFCVYAKEIMYYSKQLIYVLNTATRLCPILAFILPLPMKIKRKLHS